MLPLLLILCLTKAPLNFASPQDVELVYRPSFAEDFKGDRKEAAAKALEVVRKRVGEAGEARRDGDSIVVRATANAPGNSSR